MNEKDEETKLTNFWISKLDSDKTVIVSLVRVEIYVDLSEQELYLEATNPLSS